MRAIALALLGAFNHLERAALIALALFLVGVSAAQIILRNFFDTGLVWADPSLRLAVLWIAMIGGMEAARSRRHIAIDVLPRLLPTAPATMLSGLAALMASAICAWGAWHASRIVIMDRDYGAIAFSSIPLWVCELIIPVALAVIALRYLATFFDCLRGRPCTPRH